MGVIGLSLRVGTLEIFSTRSIPSITCAMQQKSELVLPNFHNIHSSLFFLPFQRLGEPKVCYCQTNPGKSCGSHWWKIENLECETSNKKSGKTMTDGNWRRNTRLKLTSRLGTPSVRHRKSTRGVCDSLVVFANFIRDTSVTVALVSVAVTSLEGGSCVGSAGSSSHTCGIFGMGTTCNNKGKH